MCTCGPGLWRKHNRYLTDIFFVLSRARFCICIKSACLIPSTMFGVKKLSKYNMKRYKFFKPSPPVHDCEHVLWKLWVLKRCKTRSIPKQSNLATRLIYANKIIDSGVARESDGPNCTDSQPERSTPLTMTIVTIHCMKITQIVIAWVLIKSAFWCACESYLRLVRWFWLFSGALTLILTHLFTLYLPDYYM